MTTPNEKIRGMFESQADKQVEFIIISYDSTIINHMVDLALTISNCYKITPLHKYLENLQKSNIVEYTALIKNLGSKYIEESEGYVNENPCIIFSDFQGTSRILGTIDYYEKIDRSRKYRNRCINVIMYNHKGFITTNGFLIYDSDIMTDEFRIIFLKRSKWAEMCQSFPKLSLIQGNNINILQNLTVSESWVNNVKLVIRHILTNLVDDENIINRMLSTENMETWVKMFIHPTFNYIYNYELMEFLGDSITSSKFDLYMCSKYERLNKDEATKYHNQYMSKDHQYYMSEDLKFPELVLYDKSMFTLDNKYKTDLFESFFAALFLTAQTIDYSFAEVICMNMMIMLCESLPFEKKMIFGKPRDRVDQVLKAVKMIDENKRPRFGILEERSNYGTPNARCKLIFHMDDKIILDKLKEDGKDLTSINNSHITFNPNHKSEDEAYDEMWKLISEKFEKIGFDLRYTRTLIDPFFQKLITLDNDLYNRFISKLNENFQVKQGIDPIRRIAFESDMDIRVTSMYFNTYDVPENPKLLTSLVEYTDLSQLAGSDYLEQFDENFQIINLANSKIPEGSEIICGEQLDYFKVSKYRAIENYTNH